MLSNTHALICNIAGSAKEMVFPEPVCAMATTSRPLSAIGQAWHWIGVGSEKPCARIVVIRYSGKPASSKEVTGRGTPRPWTWHALLIKASSEAGIQTYFNFFATAKFLYLPFCTGRHSSVFHIEVFLENRQLRSWPVYGTQATTKTRHFITMPSPSAIGVPSVCRPMSTISSTMTMITVVTLRRFVKIGVMKK